MISYELQLEEHSGVMYGMTTANSCAAGNLWFSRGEISALQVTASLIHTEAIKYMFANLLQHYLSAASLAGLD